MIKLDKYPKSVIEIHLLVVEDDGSIPSLAVFAAYLACSNANLSLHETLLSCTIAVTKDSSIIMDPNLAEEESATASCIVSCFPVTREVASVEFIGQADCSLLSSLVSIGVRTCTDLFEEIRDNLCFL
ncbi:hypothetical protein GEMRC1_004085 [Eukaryota sp. GEM-RC1]